MAHHPVVTDCVDAHACRAEGGPKHTACPRTRNPKHQPYRSNDPEPLVWDSPGDCGRENPGPQGTCSWPLNPPPGSHAACLEPRLHLTSLTLSEPSFADLLFLILLCQPVENLEHARLFLAASCSKLPHKEPWLLRLLHSPQGKPCTRNQTGAHSVLTDRQSVTCGGFNT